MRNVLNAKIRYAGLQKKVFVVTKYIAVTPTSG